MIEYSFAVSSQIQANDYSRKYQVFPGGYAQSEKQQIGVDYHCSTQCGNCRYEHGSL